MFGVLGDDKRGKAGGGGMAHGWGLDTRAASARRGVNSRQPGTWVSNLVMLQQQLLQRRLDLLG
jgi:hypothetical protein